MRKLLEEVGMSENFSIKVKELEDAFSTFNKLFPVPVEQDAPMLIPGIGDVFVRKVKRLGHKDIFPRHYDWENLLPQLTENEELLWIVRKNGKEAASVREGLYDFEVFLGLKYVGGDCQSEEEWRNRRRRFETLTKHFAKSAFPESLLEKNRDESAVAELLNATIRCKEARAVVGVPSLKNSELKELTVKRDDNVRPYAGLNDIVEMHGDPEDDFVLAFSVSKASAADIKQNFGALFYIQDQIKPKLEKVTTITTGENWNHTETIQDGTNESSTDEIKGGEKNLRKQRGLFPRFGRGFMNVMRWVGVGTWGKDPKEFDNPDLQIKKGVSKVHGTNHSESDADSTGGHKDTTETIKEVLSALAFVDKQLQASLEQLTQTLGTGGFYANAVVYSNDAFVADSVARATKAALSGGQSSLGAMQIVSFEQKKHQSWLAQCKMLSTALREEAICPPILNCEKACLFLPLPNTHLLGLTLKKNVFYGKERPVGKSDADSRISIGQMSYASPHILGSASHENELSVKIANKDFYSHFFIVGTTGCGKTTRAAEIIRDANGFRRIIFETAKKTYWNELEMDSSELVIYTLGDSTHNPLRINPFYFEPGTSLKQHIAVLSDAIADLLPMEALIGPKLREAIERCYLACGWDVESSERVSTNCILEYPDMALFNIFVNEVAEEMSDYSAEVQGNYKGALLNRASIFMDDVYQDIFAFDGNKTIDELFPKDKTIIVEMEEMPPSEINMPAFVLSILLQRLRAYRNRIVNENIAHDDNGFLIVIEEAHNVLSKKFQDKGDDSQSGKGGHLVNQVTRMLAEGRGLKLGLMIIDQSAANIAPSVITNTNSKLVFRQEDGTEIETIGKAIGLKKEEWNDLQLLETGEYIVRNSEFLHPVKMAPLSDGRNRQHEFIKAKSRRDDYVPHTIVRPEYKKAADLLTAYYRHLPVEVKGDEGNPMKTRRIELDTLTTGAYHDALLACARGDFALYAYFISKFLLGKHQFDLAKRFMGIEEEEAS